MKIFMLGHLAFTFSFFWKGFYSSLQSFLFLMWPSWVSFSPVKWSWAWSIINQSDAMSSESCFFDWASLHPSNRCIFLLKLVRFLLVAYKNHQWYRYIKCSLWNVIIIFQYLEAFSVHRHKTHTFQIKYLNEIIHTYTSPHTRTIFYVGFNKLENVIRRWYHLYIFQNFALSSNMKWFKSFTAFCVERYLSMEELSLQSINFPPQGLWTCCFFHLKHAPNICLLLLSDSLWNTSFLKWFSRSHFIK